MKPMIRRLLIAAFALGFCAELFAVGQSDYPRISFSSPGTSSKPPRSRDEFIFLVVEGSSLSYDGNPVRTADAVDYVNKLLETKKVTDIAIYVREGSKYGDLIQALDVLRGTQAKNIGVNMVELQAGRTP